ncbi:uncharacterized protein PITG_15428 [Phytophthora infestans T30-4]|uniref:Uncharacterized protein n=1 Tax=Phytophthora infestans (strain T30-4) TaxID=403677 RepID=D0NR82_PHYIT|nr:uncharacterized protein PITG_15428 [Phytophthora infestans T30-4]EEY63204.1 hypothetical protein PITG_15428 [Phytophthora infestans T30-4]|eukprot:XP_002898381.1 hypothetical protein PITG_15428 [Phytophthora infestans T30-4]
MMRHIAIGVEEKLHVPMPTIRDESHAIELFSTGYELLKLKPRKYKRRVDQLKLTTVLRLVREGEVPRGRVLPYKPRKHTKKVAGHLQT